MNLTSFLTHWGYLAVLALAFIQACCIPISSEITFGFAGVLAFEGHLSLPLVIVVGIVGELAGSTLAYGLGRIGGRQTVERYRRFLLMTRKDLDRVERFFDGRGSWSVTVARIIPLVRAFTGLVSGFMEVPALSFMFFNLLGTAIWACALSIIGYELGTDWDKASRNVSHATDILTGIVLLLLVGLIIHKGIQVWHEKKTDRAAAAAGQNGQAGNGQVRHYDGQDGGRPGDHDRRDHEGQSRNGHDSQAVNGNGSNGVVAGPAGTALGPGTAAGPAASPPARRAPSHRRNG